MKTLSIVGLSKRFACLLIIATLLPFAAAGGGTVTTNDEASLRAALNGGGAVVLAFDGTISLTSSLTIAAGTILDGSGHSVIISGSGSNRVFWVNSGVSFTLKNITVANGYYSGGYGAGLYNQGSVQISGCTFSNNVVSGISTFGGAIYHAGSALSINASTFVRNGADTLGGALATALPFGSSPGNIAITNCTFFENWGQALSTGSGLVAPIWLVNCTFAWNTNGAVGLSPGQNGKGLEVWNSIFADSPGASNCQGITDMGHNLSDDASLTNSSSLVNVNPLLGPLADNGGPTWTMALASGSPAIDAADESAAPLFDQRGFDRLYGYGPDIGAFEYPFPYSIAGTVFAAAPGALITVSAGTASTTHPRADGSFVVRGLDAGVYSVSAATPGASFTPVSLPAAVGPTNMHGLTFFENNALLRLGANGNQFSFTFAGTPGEAFRLFTSSNLLNWTAVATNVIPESGVGNFSAPTANSPRNFYRTTTP